MNRTMQFVIGLVALALALGAGFYGRNAYLKEVSTVQIPVPVKPIPPYTILSPDLFSLREMPRAMQALPYYQTTADMNGRISTALLPAGLPVAQGLVVQPEAFRLADAAFEVVSIPVEPVSAVGGQIHIGQRVNLYQMTDQPEAGAASIDRPNEGKTLQVKEVATSVLVVDVRSSQGLAADPLQHKKEDSSSIAGNKSVEQTQILTLALPPEQVQDVLRAVAAAKKQGGLIWTTLAQP